MKKIISYIIMVIFVITMGGVLTGCEQKENNANRASMYIDKQQQIVTNNYDKVIKVERVQEDGQKYKYYEFYTYYYFENDKLVATDLVYIFELNNNAQIWYDGHVQGLVDKSITKLEGNKVIDKDTVLKYRGMKYNDVLKMIRDDFRTISYTEQ